MSSGFPAVVLLSGGVDSATALAIARGGGFLPYALTFRYGQRHQVEVEAARRVAAQLGAREHKVVSLDLRAFGGSPLTADLPVPKGRTPEEIRRGVAPTYVPARNTIFLAYALAWAEVLGAADIFLGANAEDHAGYPDCRPAFVEAFGRLANLATRAGAEGAARFTVHAPLLGMTKAEVVRAGLALGVDYALTWSCYDPTPAGVPCGLCDACSLRRAGFTANGNPGSPAPAPLPAVPT